MDKNESVPVLQLDPGVRIKPIGPGKWLVWREGTSTFLKTSLPGYLFLMLLRQKKSVRQLASLLNDRMGSNLREEDILRIYHSRFRNKGLFLDESPLYSKRTVPHYLLWGFTLMDKDRVAAAGRFFKYLHTWPAVLIMVIWMLISVWTSNPAQTRLEALNWPMEILLTACAVLMHEFGHASALSYYGGRPGVIGAGIYAVFPVMFSDVTDAWRLSPGKRVHINLGGMYFEWIFCAILLTFSEVSAFESGKLAAVLIVLRSLWNLNPLVRGDGYWVLTDLTGIDNLNERARMEFGKWLKNPGRSLESAKCRMLAILGLLHYLAILFFLAGLLFAGYEVLRTGVLTDLVQAVLKTEEKRMAFGSVLPRLYPVILLLFILIRYLNRANVIYSLGHYFRRVVGFPGSRSTAAKE